MQQNPAAAAGKKKCILNRIYRKLFCKAGKQLQRSEPGETAYATALYEPIFTPHAQLGDFGLGLGLYFSTLRAITVLTLICGLINIPNFMYYSSADYQSVGTSNFDSYVNDTISNTLLAGSAICTDVSWVVCVDCSDLDKSDNFDRTRRAFGLHAGQGLNESIFYLRNNCTQDNIQASMINYATLIAVMVGTVLLNLYLQRMEVAYDEDEQTAQDYSVVIENPAGDATDPQEWHNFFRDSFDGAHVTACTVAVANDLLVRSLVERREKLRQIEMALEPGTSLDILTLARIAAKQERERRFFGNLKAKLSPGIPELFARVTVLNAKVQGLAQQDYPATNVFLTFETERDQRKVLQALNLGSLDVSRNKTKKVLNQQHLFRGTTVLKVAEPDEPNTVRWQDLNEEWKERIKQQLLTTFCTCVAIGLIALLVNFVNDKSLEFSAFAIAIFNSVFPIFAKMLTEIEAHSSEGGKQRSLYFKIALFRWVNTAVVITIVSAVPRATSHSDSVVFVSNVGTSHLSHSLNHFLHRLLHSHRH